MRFKSLVFGCFLLSLISIVSARQPAEAFKLKDMQGIQHQLWHYKGKWVIVNYWATWCPPCLEEVPDLVHLYDQHKTKVMVLGVVFDYKDTQEVLSYVDDMLMSYPIVLGDDAVIAQVGAADVMPTSFIYNPEGKLVQIKRGIVTRQAMEQLMGISHQ